MPLILSLSKESWFDRLTMSGWFETIWLLRKTIESQGERNETRISVRAQFALS